MATVLNNADASSDQGALSHQAPVFPIALVAAVVCGVLVGLFLGWATLEATSRSRSKCGDWCKRKVGLKSKRDRTEVTPCESATWSAQEKGQTPRSSRQTSDTLPPSLQDTFIARASTSGVLSLPYDGDDSTSTMTKAESIITTPPPKTQSMVSAANSPYSYYDADNLSTPRAPVAISEGKPSLDVDATPTKGPHQVNITVPQPTYSKLSRF